MILVVDHYDSFTYNLVQLVEGLGYATEVVKSDAEPPEALAERDPAAVILSPGPGRPEEAGCFPRLLRILPPATPVHGEASLVYHDGAGILEGVGNPFEAGRYHSLVVVRDGLPAELQLTAWTEDGLVMATQHRELPRFGVQFHPESILTPEGPRIVENFLALLK